MKKRTRNFSKLTAALVFLTAVFAIVFLGACSSTSDELCAQPWAPDTAKNASGDEVELAEIYNNVYTNYKGSLNFDKDGNFELWLSPGDPGDGTHTGTYEVTEDDKIDIVFDEGTHTQFIINRNDNGIASIKVIYGEYEVYFGKK